MRSPAELDLVRRDARIPGLGLLLDPAAMLTELRTLTGSTRLESCQLRYVRYKPGRNCLAAYSLSVDGMDWPIYAKAHAVDAPDKLNKAAQRPMGSSPLGPGRLILPGVRMEFCLFPQDNKLTSLARWTDAEWRTEFLSRKRPDWNVNESAGWRTLAYKPERRWVAALDLGSGHRGVLRIHSAETFPVVPSHWTAPVSGSVLRVAAPVLLSRSHRAVWSDWQDGTPLDGELSTGGNSACWERVGRALAEFHAQTGPGLNAPSALDTGRSLADTGRLLQFLLPGTHSRLESWIDALRRAEPSASVPPVRLHGDFSASQVLLGAHHTVALLDLDESRPGSAALDMGSFLAALDVEVIRGWLSAGRVDEVREGLLCGYARHGSKLDVSEVEYHRSVALFRRLPEFFRSGDPDWPQRTHTALEFLASRGEAAFQGRGSTVSRGPVCDPALPHLDTALCRVSMAPLLAEAMAGAGEPSPGVLLESAVLRRHKTGRRALVEYRLRSTVASAAGPVLRVLGKLQRRGLDDANLGLLQQLGRGEFHRHSPDGSSIPAMLGTVPGLGLWLQEVVSGAPLSELLATPLARPAVRRAADAIHKLHRQTLPLPRGHTSGHELRILEVHLGAVAEDRPEWRARLRRIVDQCRCLVAALPEVPLVPIHRDFYHDQVLVDGERLWLVDLDLLCAGDPALDVGNFAGHLLELAVREPAQRSNLESLTDVFLGRYQELASSVPSFVLEAYTTLTLVRHISLSTRFEARRPFTGHLLDLCEQRLGREDFPVRSNASCRASTPINVGPLP